MPDHSAMRDAIHAAIIQPGSPSLERDSTTSSTVVQPVNPAKADPHNLNLDSVVFYLGLLMLIGGVFAGINKWMRDRRKDDREWIVEQIGSVREQLDDRLEDVEAQVKTFKTKEQLAEDRAVVEDKIDTLKHTHGNELQKQSARLHTLEQGRDDVIARIVRVETNMANIEKGQAEIKSEMRHGFTEVKNEVLNAVNARNDVIDKQIGNVIESLRVMRGDYGHHKD